MLDDVLRVHILTSMNNTTTIARAETKTVGSLIEELNAKAEEAGCEVRAEHFTVDNTWGDLCGIAIVGGDEMQQERAAHFAEKYFRAHLAPKRCVATQYAWDDRGVLELERFPEYISGRGWVEGAGRLVDRVNKGNCPIVKARVVALVYYPGAD